MCFAGDVHPEAPRARLYNADAPGLAGVPQHVGRGLGCSRNLLARSGRQLSELVGREGLGRNLLSGADSAVMRMGCEQEATACHSGAGQRCMYGRLYQSQCGRLAGHCSVLAVCVWSVLMKRRKACQRRFACLGVNTR